MILRHVMDGIDKGRAAKAARRPEPFDRATRTDFWNDPERWDGVDDPHETMFWEVRRRDVIDVREKPKPKLPTSPYDNALNSGNYNQLAMMHYQQAHLLKGYRPRPVSLFGFLGL